MCDIKESQVPEGHTIHRIARDHRRDFLKQRLAVSSPQGRFTQEAMELDGQSIDSIEAHGKHLFYLWSNGLRVHIHLGLYGKFRTHKAPPPEPRGAVRVRVVGTKKAFDLNGPNRCELLTEPQQIAIQQRLGADPLRDDADPGEAWKRIRKSRAAIGTLLLNQSVIAGVGNVYRAEVLFALGIHPERAGNTLEEDEFFDVWDKLVEYLRIGVKYNRIITSDLTGPGAAPGRLRRNERLLIYKKDECPRCRESVYYWDLGSRTIYACLSCQV